MTRKEIWRHFDFFLFGTVVFLCIFGIIMIRSAIAGNAELLAANLVQRQAIFVAVGIGVLILLSVIDYRFWSSITRPLFIFTVLFLAVILIVGQVSFGAQRWLDIGFAVIQPAEVAKIVMILVLADYFAKNENREKNLYWILRSSLLLAAIVVWIYLQPNLSTSIVLVVIWFAMLWLSGLPTKYVLIFAGLAVLLFIVAFPNLEPYQQGRIMDFITQNPNATHGNQYNVIQAKISIGSGGLLGQGYGNGSQVQLRFLQVRHTDYIFSAIAEEFGFVGAATIIGLLIFIVLRCIWIARHAADTFGALISYGFAILIFFQTIVNIGVNLNVIPVTGLTLPFISYGGSSLVSLLIGIGFIESVAVHHNIG
jgi:rod shape determining protein RodA